MSVVTNYKIPINMGFFDIFICGD